MPTIPTAKPHFRVSPRVLGPLGAEQLQDPALAVLELVKNSWDADATQVVISLHQRGGSRRIVVRDNGHGMSEAEFTSRWLVIGGSYKRGVTQTEGGRPLIGEKGLGRLATFALGDTIRIESARRNQTGFEAEINWEALRSADSLEEYEILLGPKRRQQGTLVEIRDLSTEWTDEHTSFFTTHAQFLASVPGERFEIILDVNGRRYPVNDPAATLSRLSEAEMVVTVLPDGAPQVDACSVNGKDQTGIVFRPLKEQHKDSRLAGLRISLRFFRRDEAARRLKGVLQRNELVDLLERYQGVRVFRDGINVPPYGLNRDDWAGLEKQRTATGGPTMVPGNSQITGEVHITRSKHPHLVITAGRSGFADQRAVLRMAHCVRWAVRELGTARRGAALGIASGEVPGRVDEKQTATSDDSDSAARAALREAAKSAALNRDPTLRSVVVKATAAAISALDQNEDTLRLYAQLASTGIAATSFAHELRTDFDVISEAIDELKRGARRPDKELIQILNSSWLRVRAFAALFAIIPVKIRRQRKQVSPSEVERSARAILALAPPDKVRVEVLRPTRGVKLVPAELDSILINLVSNAVKAIGASRQRDSGRILVRFESRGDDFGVAVADNGCGVSPKVAAVMFHPLEGQFTDGTGMGLPIAAFIAGRYNGQVSVSPQPPQGYTTEFSAWLRDVGE